MFTSGNMEIRAKAFQVVMDFLDAEIASADDVLDLAGHEHGLEFGGEVGRPVRDVQIPQRKHKHHPPRLSPSSPSPPLLLSSTPRSASHTSRQLSI